MSKHSEYTRSATDEIWELGAAIPGHKRHVMRESPKVFKIRDMKRKRK